MLFRVTYLIFIILIAGCHFSIKDSNGTEYKITNIELTSSEKEEEDEKLILRNVNDYLISNRDSITIIQNYWYLCDSLRIRTLRDYDVRHKDANITISLTKKYVEITPIPDSYPISEGPLAEYLINDEKLGTLYTYRLKLFLTEDFKVNDAHAQIQFAKIDHEGRGRVSLRRQIDKNEIYSIKEKLKTKNWH